MAAEGYSVSMSVSVSSNDELVISLNLKQACSMFSGQELIRCIAKNRRNPFYSFGVDAGSAVLFSGEKGGKEVKALLKVKEVTQNEKVMKWKCSRKVKTHGAKANALKEANNEITNGEWGNVSLFGLGVEEELCLLKGNNIEDVKKEDGVFTVNKKKNLFTKLKMTSKNVVESVDVDVMALVESVDVDVMASGGSGGSYPGIDYFLQVEGGSGNVAVQFEYSDGGVKLKTDSIKGDNALNAALKKKSDVVITGRPRGCK